MTFEEYWRLVAELNILPNAAIRLVPDALSPKTKKRLCRKTPAETVEIVLWAICQINHGSIVTVDNLVIQKL